MATGTREKAGQDPGWLVFSPFVSSTMRVEPEWIDYNNHMNVAFYGILFDRAMDELFAVSGLGPDYVAERQQSFFVVESRASYRQELTLADTVRVTLQVMGVDDKRLHCYMEIRHALHGWVAATAEKLALHVDLTLRRATPFPADIRRMLMDLQVTHAAMPRPDKLGQGISMPRQERMN